MDNMKKHLCRLLLLVALCISCGMANAQVVSKDFEAQPLKSVLKEIEQQTGLSIIYEINEVDGEKKITKSFLNAPIEKVLSEILDKNLAFSIQNKMIVISKKDVTGTSKKNLKKITGKIIDEKGEPVIGATVLEEGTSNGAITNVDGEFSLNDVIENSILTISYVGYKTIQLKASDKKLSNIVLQEDSELIDEVVVVGYGTVKKRDLTGSVASLSSDVISSVPATSAVEALQGRASGVVVSTSNWAPGETPSILIRGKRSINASNDPLFVVDGIPVTGGMGEISPSDIESMEVLKDASATAIYGSRGANGVIIITTKQGKEGKTQIDYNGYVGVQTIQNKLDLMNGAEYAEYTREAYRNSSGSNKYLSDTPNKEQDMLLPMFKQDPYVLESVMMAYDENGNYDPSKIRSYNWFDDVTRNGLITDHQLNIRGGGAKTNFMASVTYNKTEGIMKDKDYERYSIRFNISHNINKYIKFGGQTQYSHSVQNRGSGMETDMYLYRITPLGRFINEDGTYPGLVGGDSQMYNPLMNTVEGAVDRPLKTSRYLGSYFVDIKFPVKGLSFRSNLGIDSRTVQDYEYFASATTERQLGNSAASNSVEKYSMITWENYFTYNRDFNEKHSLGVTLLQSIQQDLKETLGASVQNTPSDILKYYDLASGLLIDGVDSDYVKWNMASFMGRINYNYLGRYLLTVSARYDGSSRLADGHKWVLFPSAALAWRISDESFMKSLSWVDNLKLRLGYGKTGNSSVDPYQTRGKLGKKRYVYNNGTTEIMGYAPSLMANSSLTWETTDQWNIGFDFGFLKNRINGSVELYLQNTHDLLLERQLPVVSGFSSVMSNVGSTRNKGIEITLNTRNIQTNNFTWSTDWMFSANKEEIVELYNGKSDDIGNRWFIGNPIDVYYNYEKIGIWQNTPEDLAEMAKFNEKGGNFTVGSIKLRDVDGDYKITDKDKIILGNKRPKFVASLVNNIEYKGFDFSIFLYASIGRMLKNDIEFMEKPGRANSVRVNYWTPNNPTNDFPRPSADTEKLDYISTIGYDKADFLRIRNITLGYTLPKDLTQKVMLNKVRFYLSANNPFIFTNFTGVDPEGANGRTSPSYSTWMFGVNLSM
ncbi:TonB-dependent receptor [Bacteroides oleiciplenus]|uniref:SusC/RagA family TonB-linked outer membrane protein n=1 Tax=Bacteroides oleiciplenus YIT 12058 TaxID=742727 RepID=K9DVG8_9BACE|nr:SusC/RagA family TonB-linked outer membrane protein [Bacteroides oleiciplenus YIT 12058]